MIVKSDSTRSEGKIFSPPRVQEEGRAPKNARTPL